MAYNEYADAKQRAALIEEFYGPSFALFKVRSHIQLSLLKKCVLSWCFPSISLDLHLAKRKEKKLPACFLKLLEGVPASNE